MFAESSIKRLNPILILFLCFGLISLIFGQKNQVDQEKKLREEILAAYQSGEEQGLQDLVRKHKDKITNQFIVDFVEAGVKSRKEKWLKICEIIAEEKKDDKMLADVYYNMGEYFNLVSDYKMALNFFDKAFPIYVKTNNLVGQGKVYRGKADYYLYTGDNARALEFCNKALLLFEKKKDILGQGNVYRSKGDIYLRTGNHSEALEMYKKALIFFEKSVDFLGQGNILDPGGQGENYARRGDFYGKIGQNQKALEMYDKALSFFRKARATIDQCNVYQSKGDHYFGIGDYLRALEMYGKALPLFEKAEEPRGQGKNYERMGAIYSIIGENSKALEMFNKALPFFEKADALFNQGGVYMLKGEIYFCTGDNSKSLKMHNKALHFFKKAGTIEPESLALYCKAKVFAKLGKKEKSLELFEKGIAILEKARTQTAFSEMKKTFLEKFYGQYEKTVLFMLENKYNQKGFAYVEFMKARVFLDQMAEGLSKLEKGLAPYLKEKRDNLVAKLSYFSKKIHSSAGEKSQKKLQELRSQYRKVKNEFEELLLKIRFKNPLYASVTYPQPVSVQSMQKKVLKKGEILLRYFVSPNKLYVFLVSKNSFKVVPLDLKENEIKGLVNRYLLAMKENEWRDIKRYGKILYQILFKPLEKEIKKDIEIIIIPDEELALIPFESFATDTEESGRPFFLLEKYRIKYIQSASTLAMLRKHYQRDRETNSFIGFGDPVYDYETFKQDNTKPAPLSTAAPGGDSEIKEIHRTRYTRAGGIIPRLQGSGEEVKAIARLFEKESQKSLFHTRDQATEDIARAPEMKDFDYIHFACHGLLNDKFQCLVLSQDIPEAKDDGYFTLNEVMNCDYNAKLVVLSACQTGSGKMYRGEGVTGLTRAVMYAGTPAVLASLWKVDDNATKELMINFYKNML